MNVVWIVADTFRQDHLGCYGNSYIKTPALDAIAAKSVRFQNHYAGGFPTMPTRADQATGRWTMSFMGWEPLPEAETTLAEILAIRGYHTAAMVDTPFYIRGGMNYDRGFETFLMYPGQEGSGTRVQLVGNHEARDVTAAWSYESDRNAPSTFSNAMQWLEKHYKEDFFLLVDTWDPHEPWDAPAYFTEMYMPDYDGELVQPPYGFWYDTPGMTEELVKKAHACYCGEISMVDACIGQLLRRLEIMGLMENTAIIFTSDHGFYFGEHGGLFGKMTFDKKADGLPFQHGDSDSRWAFSPLYEELVRIPLLIYVPGVEPGVFNGTSSVVDVMPTALDALGEDIPASVQGKSLLTKMRDKSLAGRDFVVSTIPFANPGDPVRSVDNIRRQLGVPPVTTVTAGDWSLLYSTDQGVSELYNLVADPKQQQNVISKNLHVAKELHQYLIKFMADTDVPKHLVQPRMELRM